MSNMQMNLITLMIISSARMTQHYYNLTDLKHRFIKCPFLTLTQCGRLFLFLTTASVLIAPLIGHVVSKYLLRFLR